MPAELRPTRLKDINSGENMYLLTLAVRIGPPVMLILLLIEYAFFRGRFLWFILPDVAATGLVVLGARWALDYFGRAAVSILMPSGKSTPALRQYSEQEAMVIRGR